MIVLLAVLVGGVVGTLATVLVFAFSIAGALGLAGYIGFPLTPVSAAAPTIILTVAVANCVHVLVSFLFGMRHGLSKPEALEESLRINLQPVFLASVTTAIGFLSLNFSEVPPFQHLGTIVALGVLISFVLAVSFLPALIAVLPVRTPAQTSDDDSMMVRFGDFVVHNRSPLLWGMSLVVIVLVANVPRNELNDVFLHWFDQSIQFRTDTDFALDNLTGLYTTEYSLRSGESGGISKPEFLAEVEAFANWMRQQHGVRHVRSFTDIMKRLNKNLHEDAETMYRLPGERALAAQYLLLYEMSLPYGLDLNNQINVDKSSVRLTATTDTLSTKEILALSAMAAEWLETNAPHIDARPASGAVIMFANIGHRNVRAMLLGTTIALALISCILIAALRSVKIGIVSLIPNLVPAAMGFGLWGIFVGEVGLSLSIVMSMTLGIVIDDTVHFLSKYLRARREQGLNPQDAVRYAFRTVGRALLVTSIILVVGFSVLAQSGFAANGDMGLLTAVVIALAIFADFLFLPPLLMKIEDKKDRRSRNPVALSSPV
jgi:predicted RND superfamily exporter protein